MYKLIINKIYKVEYKDYDRAFENYVKVIFKYDNVELIDQNDKVLCKTA